MGSILLLLLHIGVLHGTYTIIIITHRSASWDLYYYYYYYYYYTSEHFMGSILLLLLHRSASWDLYYYYNYT